MCDNARGGRWVRLTGVLLLNLEELVDALANLTLGELDVVLGDTIVGHQGEEAIVRDVDLGEGQ